MGLDHHTVHHKLSSSVVVNKHVDWSWEFVKSQDQSKRDKIVSDERKNRPAKIYKTRYCSECEITDEKEILYVHRKDTKPLCESCMKFSVDEVHGPFSVDFDYLRYY